jgi:HK97 family phage major capsid protein
MKIRNFKDERFKGWCSRSIPLKFESIDDKTRSVECIMTTEDPAIVFDWWEWKYIREIILMRGVEFESEIPFINSHKRDDIENLLGTTKEIRTEGDLLIGRNYFSVTAEKAWTLTKEGHLKNYSVGYQTYEEESNVLKTGQEIDIDGRKFINNYSDGLDLVIRKRATMKENSSVILGADKRAKARAEGGVSVEDEDLQDELEKMFEKFEQKLDIKINSIKSQGGPNMDELTKKTPEQLREEACMEIEKSKSMFDGAFKHKADEAILKLKSGAEVNIGEFYKSLYDEVQRNGGHASKPVSHMDFSKSESESYSPSRAIGKILRGEKRDGLEFEVSDQISKDSGQPASEKGFFLAANFQARALDALAKRAHSIGTPAEGGYFETDDFRPDMLKEVVRNQTVLGAAGSTIVTGLNGPLVVPKIVTSLTSYTPLENIAVDKSYIVVDTDEVSPKRISTATELGREQFIRTNKGLGGLDQILIRELYSTQNVKLDYEGINGTGLSGRPTGILNMSGMSAPSMSIVNLKKMVNFIRLVAKANGLVQNMKWVNSVDVESLLRIAPVDSSGIEKLFDYKTRTIQGYPSISSNQIPDAVNIFGNWPEYYTLLWGVEELIVADQPQHLKWMVEFSLHRLANFYLRSSESIAIADDAPITDWDE